MSATLTNLAMIVIAAFAGASLILLLQALQGRRRRAVEAKRADGSGKTAVFLFRNDVLVDASDDALALIAHRPPQQTEFAATIAALTCSFPDLPTSLTSHAFGKTRLNSPTHATLSLCLHRTAHSLRLSVRDGCSATPLAQLTRNIANTEADRLRDVAHHSPQLIWQTDAAGRLIWANRTFQAHCAEDPARPEALQALSDVMLPNAMEEGNTHRIALRPNDPDNPQWMDVFTVSHPQNALHFASDANAIMRADDARRDFVKTLGKTFAHLSTGLAIFDKDRRLAMFNPALLDMTQLAVDFLSTRPSIDMVLDRLREQRMLPEPRDYASWRDQFAAVEDAAKNGTYAANWSLPNGQTMRVMGKPHPDGAFAFLFEDITAEVSLTRRFRTDIETGQAVLDAIPDGIAVFSQSGTLMMSNEPYARLWQTSPDTMLDLRDVTTELAVWQAHSVPTPTWDRLSDMLQTLGPRQQWSNDIMLDDGRLMRCHTTPLAGGMTMVRFAVAPPLRAPINPLSSRDATLQIVKR